METEKKQTFADIHNHALFGVDDGARTESDMERMIDASYLDGVRYICFTPHFHPGYFGNNLEQTTRAFDSAKQYAMEHYPNLHLYLGNEIRYEPSCTENLRKGRCKTVNATDYLLVDFLYDEAPERIMRAVRQILNSGYIPILAHVERYRLFRRNLQEVKQLRAWGAIIQIDSQSVLGGLGQGSKCRSRQLLKMRLADLIASDAHGTDFRPPQLKPCFDYVAEHWGYEYARSLFLRNPLMILHGEQISDDGSGVKE